LKLATFETDLLATSASHTPVVFFILFMYTCIYVFAQKININNPDQKLLCPIQFQSFVFLDSPNGTVQGKDEKQW
jgi:hypothetical protein